MDDELDKENSRKCIEANTDQDLRYKFEVQSIKDNHSDTEAEVTDFGNNDLDLNSSYSEKSEVLFYLEIEKYFVHITLNYRRMMMSRTMDQPKEK